MLQWQRSWLCGAVVLVALLCADNARIPVRIMTIAAIAFSVGFEYSFPVKRVRGILILSVLITTILYLFVSILSVSAYPPEYDSWMAYISDMGNLSWIKAVPAFYAAQYLIYALQLYLNGLTGICMMIRQD